MGITGLIPFLEKASRKTNISEFNGSTVAIDSYCWLHKGAFACADNIFRGKDTDIHIKYCMKYVNMLLSKNIKPILVFDGRHLPAKAMTETKRRESRSIYKKRAAELLSLGKIDEARSYIRRSVDITHSMALQLIKECRKRNVDCIVAPYEADAELAYLNIKNIAQLVITEDSDLILFGCTKVLFKMDLEGNGTLVDTAKLPLVMKCPIEQYHFDKFRRMCIMSGCDYLASLPGIGLAKARQFVTATQDSNFANALRKLPSFFNRSNLIVTDEYRENFLKAEATFKHQYIYDPINRKMLRLTETDDEDVEKALCVNAGELLDDNVAFQLALGNLDPFTLKKMDNWHPDDPVMIDSSSLKTNSWHEKGIANHPSIWNEGFKVHLTDNSPWVKKVKKQEPVGWTLTRPVKKVVTLTSKYVPETQEQNLTIEDLSKMYYMEPAEKKQKVDTETQCSESYSATSHNIAFTKGDMSKESAQKQRSPILENKDRSFRKCFKNGTYSVLRKLSKFPRTVLDENIVESKFFNNNSEVLEKDLAKEDSEQSQIERSQTEHSQIVDTLRDKRSDGLDAECLTILDSQLENCQKENCDSPTKSYQKSPILEPSPKSKNPFKIKNSQTSTDTGFSEESVIENTFPIDSQVTADLSPTSSRSLFDSYQHKTNIRANGVKNACRVSGLKRSTYSPRNQTLLSKFGFQKKPVCKR